MALFIPLFWVAERAFAGNTVEACKVFHEVNGRFRRCGCADGPYACTVLCRRALVSTDALVDVIATCGDDAVARRLSNLLFELQSSSGRALCGA